jgi:hypothetical protein
MHHRLFVRKLRKRFAICMDFWEMWVAHIGAKWRMTLNGFSNALIPSGR